MLSYVGSQYAGSCESFAAEHTFIGPLTGVYSQMFVETGWLAELLRADIALMGSMFLVYMEYMYS